MQEITKFVPYEVLSTLSVLPKYRGNAHSVRGGMKADGYLRTVKKNIYILS